MNMFSDLFNSGGSDFGGGGASSDGDDSRSAADEGGGDVSSRNVRICVVDVNSVLDDHYDLHVNGRYVGAVHNIEGGSTCYNVMLMPGNNKVQLRLVKKMGKDTRLKIDINGGEFLGEFTGTHTHNWTINAPMW